MLARNLTCVDSTNGMPGRRIPGATTDTLLLQMSGCKQLFDVQFDGVAVGHGLRFSTSDRHAALRMVEFEVAIRDDIAELEKVNVTTFGAC